MPSKESTKELKARITQLEELLEKRTYELTREITDYVIIRTDLDKRTRELNQRLKELNCMLQISRLSDREELSFDEYIKEALRIIVSSFEHADIAGAELRIEGEQYHTPGFQASEWKIGRGLMDNDRMMGYLTVCLSEKRTDEEHGPFTKEEKNFMIMITRYLVQIIKRKRLEEQLHKFGELVTRSPNMITITDHQGRIEYINDQVTQTLGYELNEIKGQLKVFIPTDPAGSAIQEEMIRTLSRQKVFSGEFQVTRKDGSLVWVRASVSPILKNKKIVSFISISNDITEDIDNKRKKWEQEERYRKVMENIPVSIILSDREGRFCFANRQAERILGMPLEKILEKSITDIFPEEGIPTLKMIRQIFSDKKGRNIEVKYTISGKERLFEMIRTPIFDSEGNVVYVMSISTEITEKRKLDNLFRFQYSIDSLQSIADTYEKSLKLLFNNLFSLQWIDVGGLYVFDQERDVLQLIYHRGLSEKFLGKTSSYRMDSKNVQLILEKKPIFAQITDVRSDTREVTIAEGVRFICVLPLIYQEKVIGCLNLGSKHIDQLSEFDRMAITSISGRVANVVELLRTQAHLQKTNEELAGALKTLQENRQMLIQKSRLESLGELSAGLAHEINQPLSVISLGMENLEARINQGKADQQYLLTKFGSISNNIQKIKQLIDHFRIFSRDQKETIFERIDVNQTIHEAFSFTMEQLRSHRIAVQFDLEEELGFSLGNSSRLEQVILNLISNSRDALDEKEQNSVIPGMDKKIKVITRKKNKGIEIIFRDNGTGMSKENREKIFDPFFTTKPAGKGTGLGMAIVYGIIRDMNGEIQVKSKVGEHTEIKIWLPFYHLKERNT